MVSRFHLDCADFDGAAKTVPLDSIYIINDSRVVWSHLPDEVVITDRITDELFGLKNTAMFIWLNLNNITPLSEILSKLCHIYPASSSTIKNDVIDFVCKTETMGLITKIK